MLNVAYLNGAEGLHKRGGASSGGSSGGEGNVEYLDISNLDNANKVNLVVKSNIIKIEKYGAIMCTTPTMVLDPMSGSIGEILDYYANATIAVCIDFNLVNKYPDGEFTNKELLLGYEFTQEELDAIPRITKEEFYNLEA